MANKIGAKIVIDGESEFRANLTSAKKALDNFQSELKLVTTQFKNNANSLEALRAKQEAYIKLQEEQKNKVSLLAEMQDKVIKKYEAETSTLQDLGQQRDKLNAALEEAKNTYGENSEEAQKLTGELEEVNSQYEAQEKIVQKTGDKLNTYQKGLNDAETELAKLNDEVQQNEKYLSEAENSADGCAESIDEFGNKVQQSTKNLSEAENSADDCAESIDELGNEAQDAAEKTSVFGDVLKAELVAGVIKEGIKAIANGIKDIATAATSTGMQFETSMSKVAATMGITVEEINNGSESYEILTKAAEDCGKATMFSASQSAEALNYLALAGYDAEKAAATLPKVLNLAAAGGLDLAYASDLVTDSMAALGLETEELDNYIDEMAKTSQKSNTNISQLGEATLVCAGTVSLTGQKLETMNTALGVLANNGIKGAEGGTHLRNMLLSLSAPTEKAADAIEGLGLKVYDSQGNMRDFYDIMCDLDSITAEMTMDERTKKFNTIFNKTDLGAVNAMLKSVNGEYSALNQQINNCSGAAQDMADTLNDTLNGKVTILKSALEGLGITAYNLFDDEMKSAVEAATDAVGELQNEIDNGSLGVSLSNMSEALGEFTEKAIEAAQNALPGMIDGLTWLLDNADMVAGLIGGVTSAKIAYTAATQTATVVQKLFNVTANANPYILLATAITGVVGAIAVYSKTASKSTDTLTESTKKLTDTTKKLNTETAQAAKERADNIANFEAEKAACTKLAEELDALQNKTSLTTAEQARQQAIVEQLNTALPDLNLYIDEQTGLTNMSTDAILENIEAQLELAKAEAAREDLTEIAKEQYESEKQLAELEKERNELIDKRHELYEQLKEEADGAGEIRYSDESQEALAQYNEDIKALTEEISNTKDTINALGTEYEETTAYIAENEALAAASGAMGELGDAAGTAGDKIYTMSEEAQESFNEMYEAVAETIEKQTNVFEKFSEGAKLSKEELMSNMQSQIDGVTSWADNLELLAKRDIDDGLLKTLAEMGPQGAGYVAAFVEMLDDELEKANELFAEAAMLSTDVTNSIMDSYMVAGGYAGQGYDEGLESTFGEIENTMTEMANNSTEVLKTGLDEHSPSKKTEEIGKYAGEGLAVGISNSEKKIIEVIKKVTSGMLNSAKTGASAASYNTIGGQITEGLRQGIESGRSGVIEAIRSMCADAIKTAQSALDIHSPSKAFAYLGEMSGEGYITGWEETMANIDSVIADSLPDIPPDTNNFYTSVQSANVQENQAAAICERIYDVISQYMPQMAGTKVVLDTGTLVGELVEDIDERLGTIKIERARGG